jgi:translation initiation factor 3 subunit E
MPVLKELDAAGNFNLEYLREHHGVTAEHVEALYECAKFRYDNGEYAVAADYLHYYRLLVGTNHGPAAGEVLGAGAGAASGAPGSSGDRSIQALWGRFGAEILCELWEEASRDLHQLLGAIRQSHQPDLQLMQQRAWLLHWSLFVFANQPSGNGKDALVDFFLSDGVDKVREKITNINVIILTCPWLLRYLVACVLVQKKRHNYLKTLLRLLSPADVAGLQDPMIDFLYKLLGSFDFEGAQQKLADCAGVISTDYFLSSMMTTEEFLAAARRFVFEVYCRVHQKIDLR